VLAVADRIDSIVQCFNVGAVPTGSKDPLALRRQAIAVLKILAARSWSGVTLSSLLGPCRDDAVRNAVVAFVGERFSGILTADLNVPTDFAAAVLAADFAGARPADTVARAVSIRDFALEAEGFRDFLDSVYKRVLNLLKQADEKVPGWREAAQSRGLLDIDGDFDAALGHELEKLVESTRRHALGAYHRARESGVYHDLLAALYTFKDPLARFFGTGRDGVPVLIEEDELKRLGRLALLHRVFQLFGWFADFGRISTR
jgi:glycyl-tRNA synthetase beta chain